MTYIKQDIIPAHKIGKYQVPELLRAERADKTYDVFLGVTNGVPYNIAYLCGIGQAGLHIGYDNTTSIDYGEYSIQQNAGAPTVRLLNLDCNSNNVDSAVAFKFKLDNKLNLIPRYIYMQADGDYGGSGGSTIYDYQGNAVKNMGNGYQFSYTELLLDYHTEDFYYGWGHARDGSKYRWTRAVISVDFMQRIAYTSEVYQYFK